MELRDPHKATSTYLASAGGKMAWGTAESQRAHAATAGVTATNDASEKCFSTFTYYYNMHGTISVESASGVAQARSNDDFGLRAGARLCVESRRGKRVGAALAAGSTAARAAEKPGFLQQLPEQLQEAVIKMAMQDLEVRAAMP